MKSTVLRMMQHVIIHYLLSYQHVTSLLLSCIPMQQIVYYHTRTLTARNGAPTLLHKSIRVKVKCLT